MLGTSIVRWAAIGLGAVVLAALGFIAWVHLASEARMRSFDAPPPFGVAIPEDADSIARGRHIVLTRGCAGCHGADLEGRMMWGNAAAPNLAAYAREHDAATIERAVRHGIDSKGRGMYSMPAYNFTHLTDEDMASLIAYLRSAPVAEGPRLMPRVPFETRLAIALGQDNVMPAWMSHVPPLEHRDNPDLSIARGEYIAMTTCNECHGFSLRADVPWESDGATPDLIAMMAGYEEADFRRLLQEGAPIGGRDLDRMDDVARSRFAHFAEEELRDLYAYLRFRTDRLLSEGD